jgi:hypothetical protein
MNPRVLVGVIGVIAIVTAIAFFMTPQSPSGAPLFGCGTILSPKEQMEVWENAACQNAFNELKTWTIPLAFAGLVALGGAIAIKPRRPTGRQADNGA